MTLPDEVAKAFKSLPFYLLVPSLAFASVGVFLVMYTGNSRDAIGISHGFLIGLLFGGLAWTLRQIARFAWFFAHINER